MAKVARAQFFVVVRSGDSLDLQQVPVTSDLQVNLSADFINQLNSFVDGKERVPFSPSYQPDPNELFEIKNFSLPSFLQYAVTSPDHYSALALPFTPSGPLVKAVLV